MKYNFENLEVWKLGMELVHNVYKSVKTFPDSEKFTLRDQFTRASISIPLNIAEGSGKPTQKEFIKYIRNSIGSLLETVTCIKIAFQENYIDNKTKEDLKKQTQKLYFKLIALEKSLDPTKRKQ